MDRVWSDFNFNLPASLLADDGIFNGPTKEAFETARRKRRRPTSDQDMFLACNACRQKKVKLEAELRKHGLDVPPSSEPAGEPTDVSSQLSDSTRHESLNSSRGGIQSRRSSTNLIGRLCRAEPRISTDRAGRLHFYGPSSSLHTAESISSWFSCSETLGGVPQNNARELPCKLQNHLLDHYWKYQHGVIQLVNRQAFLSDMEAGRCRYYSKALLYAILASAARVSDYPEIRALVVPAEVETHSYRCEEPYLFRKATTLVEEELQNDASVTTVQALGLLSVICVSYSGSDVRGWMDSGRAIRLAFEFGLNHELSKVREDSCTQMDSEVRRTAFWGCFTLDQLWSTYLGRPHLISLDDVTQSRPAASPGEHKWDDIIAGAWAGLSELLERICDSINRKLPSNMLLQQDARKWLSALHPSLHYAPESPPAVHVLHLHYHSACMLERLSEARFGAAIPDISPETVTARSTCISHALRVAAITKDYRTHHGSARTMIGNSISGIIVAVLVLIANWMDRGESDAGECLELVDSCVRSVQEMQVSFACARTLSKQVLYLMRRYNFPSLPSQSRTTWNEADNSLLSQLSQSLPIFSSEPGSVISHEHDLDLFPAMFEHGGFEMSMPWTMSPEVMGLL
ncbi:hypothetical protein Z517_10085 [Fonsecaea pedrosoi CBS 271.37]|uniref:Unplaced genomic scaffold supercont1.7, whole genome shotgun sequence n=1 Tax=Fonsecaea pedrosoi CBS 271.37 TaxID=1442368 RepID=A0A0D2GS99_9EURO|nr:uncharacterized protein Z517_10085 [Fonsecaea pedrosoi CBS 271.37]KIW75344.1 hypothetical protein Z517_10085 [Fonsecaea pedrosoi CBS 271.37]